MRRRYRACPNGYREGRKIFCKDGGPCPFTRYCQLEDQWLQNDEVNCRRLEEIIDGKRRNAD